MIEIGKIIDNFKLLDHDEKEINLYDYSGKWVIVYFYPKDNTPGCTTEAIDFTCRIDDFNGKNAVILGISPDSPKSHVNFINKHDLKIRLLSDPEHKVLEYFGSWGLKKLYGREYMGVIRSTFLIDPEGRLVKKWPKVKLKGHIDEVFETLNEMQNI